MSTSNTRDNQPAQGAARAPSAQTDAKTDGKAGVLRAGRLEDSYKALGAAVSLFMADPSFARLPFGHWSRILAGQIRRKHYLLVLEGEAIVGFLGWALTTEPLAEDWLEGRGELKFEDTQAGECILINAWMARNERANRFLLSQMRQIGKNHKAVYAKRFYPDGRMRRMKLSVNDFVKQHLARGDGKA